MFRPVSIDDDNNLADANEWLTRQGTDHDIVILPPAWHDGVALYDSDPSDEVERLRKLGLDVGAVDKRSEAHFHFHADWLIILMVAADVFSNTTGQLLADYLKGRWFDVQETMKKVWGGEPADHLEGRMIVDVGFHKEGTVRWFRADGQAEDVLAALKQLTPTDQS